MADLPPPALHQRHGSACRAASEPGGERDRPLGCFGGLLGHEGRRSAAPPATGPGHGPRRPRRATPPPGCGRTGATPQDGRSGRRAPARTPGPPGPTMPTSSATSGDRVPVPSKRARTDAASQSQSTACSTPRRVARTARDERGDGSVVQVPAASPGADHAPAEAVPRHRGGQVQEVAAEFPAGRRRGQERDVTGQRAQVAGMVGQAFQSPAAPPASHWARRGASTPESAP